MLLGSGVLEVAIGLVFVYLLLSLLCSAAGEYIEAKFNNRAKYLRQGIELLLNETKGGGVDLASQLYEHGLVRPLYRTNTKLPSYIPSRTFALALWNMAANAGADGQGSPVGVINDLGRVREIVAKTVPNVELRTALLTLIDEADGDLNRARQNVEEWYEAMMDRVSGWYKRRVTVLMLGLGFVVAAAINADTISLARSLANDGALRRSVAAVAEQRLTMSPGAQPVDAGATAEERDRAATARLRAAYGEVAALGLPIGWVRNDGGNDADPRRVPSSPADWLLKLCGLLLTGFAISQGSPFWFDLLNRFMVIRSTVKPTEKSKDQPSKERPAPQGRLPERDGDKDSGADSKG